MLADTASRSWVCCAGSMFAGVDVAVAPGPRVAHVRRRPASVSASSGTSWVSRSCAGRGSGADIRANRASASAVVAQRVRYADRDQPVVTGPEPRRLARRLHDDLSVERRTGSPRTSARARVRRRRAPSRLSPKPVCTARVARVDDRPARSQPAARRPADRPAAPRRGRRPAARRGGRGHAGSLFEPQRSEIRRVLTRGHLLLLGGCLRGRCDEVVAGVLAPATSPGARRRAA